MLTENEKIFLLELSRNTLQEYLETRQFKAPKEISPSLKQKIGVFITLYDQSQARGTAGTPLGTHPLYEMVQAMAVQAAVGDPLFPALHKEELKRIRIEISVLSAFKKMKTIEDIEMGRHGIKIHFLDHEGFLLPHIATQNHWDKLTFLAHVCQKAGLSSHAWREKNANVEICLVDTFCE